MLLLFGEKTSPKKQTVGATQKASNKAKNTESFKRAENLERILRREEDISQHDASQQKNIIELAR